MERMISVQVIIAYYMFISVTLLVFNMMHVVVKQGIDIRYKRRTDSWFWEISRQLSVLEKDPGDQADHEHQKKIKSKLKKTSELMSYFSAMQQAEMTHPPERIKKYLRVYHDGFYYLAVVYTRRRDMEKSYFAFVLSQFPPKTEEMEALEEGMLRFLLGTSMYCRENALRALYAFGDASAVVRAYEMLAEHDIFHHEMMLVQGLMSFSGEKEELAAQLAVYITVWPAHMGVAVVQLISNCRADYRQMFHDMLMMPETDAVVRIAMLHYYELHPYEPVRPLLIEYLKQMDRTTPKLAAAAAATLRVYPGEESVKALLSALSGPNWFVRASAARSLLVLGADPDEVDKVLAKDRYALDMMRYQSQSLDAEDWAPHCIIRRIEN